jgi:urea transporter
MIDRTATYLENISNVLFFKNAYFGFLFLTLGIFFDAHLVLSGVFASAVGYYFSVHNRTPKILRETGLLTINGFFFGIAMASLFPDSVQFYIFLVVGAMAVPLATLAANEILQHWKLSPFIISYILVVWVFFLSARAISAEFIYPMAGHGQGLQSSPIVMQLISSPFLFVRFCTSVFMGMGYLFFLPNPIFGLLILILISLFSPRQGFYFLVGTALATLAAYIMVQQKTPMIDFGHYTYSAGLIGLGLASWPDKFNYSRILLFCLLSVFVTLALVQLFSTFGLPVLSLPYVLTIWLALLSRTPRFNLSWAE